MPYWMDGVLEAERMRWGIDEVPLLLITRYALGGEEHRLTVVIAIDLFLRR